MAEEKAGGPERQSSGRSYTWLWMILALAVMGGYFYWMGATSEPSSLAVVEDTTAEEEEEPDGAVVVDKDSLAANKAVYQGQLVRVDRVQATASLGPAIFWGELGTQANQMPILVRLDSTAAEGWEMRQGARYTVTGEVLRMSDSLATVWGEQDEFTGEGEQMQAAFTDYFIQASRIRPSRGGESRREESQGDESNPAGSANSG
ncbi:MAG: hypothetical protein ACLFRX_07045 [Gemmatimonadota bacterium]